VKLLPILALVAAPLLGACGQSLVRTSAVPGSYDAAEVQLALEQARAELARREGRDVANALARMDVASETRGLSPEVRRQVQQLLTQAAQARLEELSEGSDHAQELEEIAELELPRELAVRLSVEAASQYLESGERMECYRHVKQLDERYPLHAERVTTGALVAEAGLSLARDRGRYGLFFRYRNLAPEVLEYFTTQYPKDGRGPEAYLALAAHYERQRRWDLAIGYHEDLILFHPGSPEAARSRGHIPRLRLGRLPSPEYDRSVVLQALSEISGWLADFPDHAMEFEMKELWYDCQRRLADHEMTVARFYRTVGNRSGAVFHAEQAVERARDGQDLDQIAEAEELQADVAGMAEDDA
jgi:tetratricopeptide (TPR) repeat protein